MFEALAFEVLPMVAPALPLAVAEFDCGVAERAVTDVLNSDPAPVLRLAALPIPLTVTSLLSVLLVVPDEVLAALNVPLITPLAASLEAVELRKSLVAVLRTELIEASIFDAVVPLFLVSSVVLMSDDSTFL